MTATGPVDNVVHGVVADGFESVREEMRTALLVDPTFSAQFCAYVEGRPAVDIWCGSGVEADDLQGIFSVTKGAAAICIALLLDRGVLDLDAPVTHYWPEFGSAGKADITVRLLLSHQAGLVGVEPQVSHEELLDHEAMAARLAARRPAWHPGVAHGYHGFTIGTLMDELVRRIDGRPLARFFREEIGDPRGIDVFIATPAAVAGRIRDVLPAEPTPEQLEELAGVLPAPPEPDSLAGMAYNSARENITSLIRFANDPDLRATGQAATTAVGSARGLARLYASCLGEVDGIPALLSPETMAAMAQQQAAGYDLVLRLPMRFAVVFQKPDERLWFGSHQAFGHDGAGGGIGVADPWHGLAYGYLPRRMSFPGGADERGLQLANAVRRCLA